jgi:hypothetical protein
VKESEPQPHVVPCIITHKVHNWVKVEEKRDGRNSIGQESDQEVENTITKEELP